MSDSTTLEELNLALEAKADELRADQGERRAELLEDHRCIRDRIRAKKHELYFSLELPEPLGLDGLDIEGLRAQLELLHSYFRACFDPLHELESAQEEARRLRLAALRAQQREIQAQIDRTLEADYAPGPEDPPAYEPSGYESKPGFVKARPENNGHYLEQFKDHPWYPAISAAHSRLEELIPGYNISQIKEKFGGLRYYFDYPEVIPLRPGWPAYSSEDKIKAMVENAIVRAESWVDGYEHAKTEANRDRQKE